MMHPDSLPLAELTSLLTGLATALPSSGRHLTTRCQRLNLIYFNFLFFKSIVPEWFVFCHFFFYQNPVALKLMSISLKVIKSKKFLPEKKSSFAFLLCNSQTPGRNGLVYFCCCQSHPLSASRSSEAENLWFKLFKVKLVLLIEF